MRCLLLFASIALLPTTFVRANLVLNEVLASTIGTDSEFIEIYNSGPAAVDVSGWEIRQYESDAGGSFGNLDETNLIPGPAGTHVIGSGGRLLLGNAEFQTAFGIVPDISFSNAGLSVENSSVTLQLFDTVSNTSIYTAFLSDGGAGDSPNIAGAGITPDISVGPDGTFFPAGYQLNGDAGTTASLLEFSPKPAPSATPGAINAVPEPSSLAMLGFTGFGICLFRCRRRS